MLARARNQTRITYLISCAAYIWADCFVLWLAGNPALKMQHWTRGLEVRPSPDTLGEFCRNLEHSASAQPDGQPVAAVNAQRQQDLPQSRGQKQKETPQESSSQVWMTSEMALVANSRCCCQIHACLHTCLVISCVKSAISVLLLV